MNQRGLLFTIMLLFIALTFIGINSNFNDIRRGSINLGGAYLDSATNKYDNIHRQIVDFDKAGYNKVIASRVLPFESSLSSDNNSITITQELPISLSRIQNVFDFLNLAKIFFKDTDWSNKIYDGTIIDINSLLGTWGSGQTRLPFVIDPVCYSYEVTDENLTKIYSMNSAPCPALDYRRMDVNVILNAGDDYNAVSCSPGPCPASAYSSSNPLPYVVINIIDSNCASCVIPSPKSISTHFSPASTFSVTLSCTGTCTSTPIIISQQQNDWNFFHAGGRIETISANLQFNRELRNFYIPDVNISVKSPLEDYAKTK